MTEIEERTLSAVERHRLRDTLSELEGVITDLRTAINRNPVNVTEGGLIWNSVSALGGESAIVQEILFPEGGPLG